MPSRTKARPVTTVVPASDPLLRRERRTYEARKAELLREAEGRFVLINGDTVVDFFDTYLDAAREGWRRFGNVPLLVKRIQETEVIETIGPVAVDATPSLGQTSYPEYAVCLEIPSVSAFELPVVAMPLHGP